MVLLMSGYPIERVHTLIKTLKISESSPVTLGNGASCCAVEYGRSIETSMGMTPLEGLVMGTRSGDIDPGAIFSLMRAEDLSPEDMEDFLNRSSGLQWFVGFGQRYARYCTSSRRRKRSGSSRNTCICTSESKVYWCICSHHGWCRCDCLHSRCGRDSARIRQQVAQRLKFLGARLDLEKNRARQQTK